MQTIKRSEVLCIVGLLVLAFAARYMVADRAIWFDERFTLNNTGSVSAAVEHCLKDVHPPLYFVVTALWRSVLPSTDASMRLLSLIFGMGSLAAILVIARTIAGWRAGIAALAVAALAPYHWLYSTELRPYALFLAFSAFAVWAFLNILKTGKLRYFLLLALFTALNLYTHYFAVFLLLAQALVLLVAAFRNSASGLWTPRHRNRIILHGILALVLIAVAYAPWLGVLRRVVTESVVDGHVVGAGRRVGRGVTVGLIGTSFYDSMGQGLIPFVLQAILLGFAVSDRRFRGASLLLGAVWLLPFILLKLWRPGHFIAAKYFLYAYPMTVAMVGVGASAMADLIGRGHRRSAVISFLLVAVVSLSPLMPGQRKPYAFHRSDWLDVVTDIGEYMKPGERISFPGDPKSQAMVMHYAEEGFFDLHPVILWRPGAGTGAFVSEGAGRDIWLLKRGSLPPDFADDLGDSLEVVETWHIYPNDITLYRLEAGKAASGIRPDPEERGAE
ncbi:MAG: glycosyltransferase family 39 protein [bacterium]|jgi:hypothetical protein